MKLSDLFVIVCPYEDHYGYFLSPDCDVYTSKEEADTECERLTKEKWDSLQTEPREDITFFKVLPLDKAKEKYTDLVADHYTEHDESY